MGLGGWVLSQNTRSWRNGRGLLGWQSTSVRLALPVGVRRVFSRKQGFLRDLKKHFINKCSCFLNCHCLFFSCSPEAELASENWMFSPGREFPKASVFGRRKLGVGWARRFSRRSGGCRKIRPTPLPARSSGSKGGRGRAGAPRSPQLSPYPYLELTAAATETGGPGTGSPSWWPFVRMPGGARPDSWHTSTGRWCGP